MAFRDFINRLWSKARSGGEAAPTPAPDASGLRNADWLLSGSWLHLGSSNLEAAKYDYDDQILTISYKSKRLADGTVTPESFYSYFGVPPEVADGLSTTNSPGRYRWSNLKPGDYPYIRLSGFASRTRTGPTVIRTVDNQKLSRRPLMPKWMRR